MYVQLILLLGPGFVRQKNRPGQQRMQLMQLSVDQTKIKWNVTAAEKQQERKHTSAADKYNEEKR